MSSNLIRDWMTTSPVTIGPKTTVPEAHKLMKERGFRRLPVVDEHNRLIGIVTLSDLREAGPSSATTLSIFELNYLLAQLTVDKIMTRDVITVPLDATIRDAARLMLKHEVGALPVMDGDKLVGIITESDIFRIIVQQPEALA
ncbi:MAG: CBS domain-containing protein [Candidatus Roseilinea sp.]|uniref:CBS domain-containing protein n=1 Tax=Candidatus Roseilinea sp. TaxID=2838777 RepID=UPI00404AABD5